MPRLFELPSQPAQADGRVLVRPARVREQTGPVNGRDLRQLAEPGPGCVAKLLERFQVGRSATVSEVSRTGKVYQERVCRGATRADVCPMCTEAARRKIGQGQPAQFVSRMSPSKVPLRLTSSGRRRSRRECLVGRPRSPFAEGVENKLPQGVPRRGLVVRPTVAASLSLPPSTLPRLRPGAACRRAGRRPSVSRPFCEGDSMSMRTGVSALVKGLRAERRC